MRAVHLRPMQWPIALLAERNALKAQLADLIGDVIGAAGIRAERDALKAELAVMSPAKEWRCGFPDAEMWSEPQRSHPYPNGHQISSMVVQSRTVCRSEWRAEDVL
jgi:hypothetical protein